MISWARVRAPARSSGRLPTGAQASSSAAPDLAPARVRRTTAISSSRCSAARVTGRGRRSRRGFDTGRGEDHHAKVLLDLDATLHGGSGPSPCGYRRSTRKGTSSPPGARPQCTSAQGHSSRPDDTTCRSRRPPARRARRRVPPRAICTSRSNSSRTRCIAIEGRDLYLELPVAPWEAALGATRQDADAAGHRRFEDPGGRARRHQTQTEGSRDSIIAARRSLRGAADRLPPAATRPGQGRLSRPGRSRAAVQSARQPRSVSPCQCHKGEAALPGEIVEECFRPQRRGLESNVCGRRASHRRVGRGRRPHRD